MKMVLALAAIMLMAGSCAADDMTVPYFTSVSLHCDSLALNVSDNMGQVQKMYWILSDGALIDGSTPNLPESITFSTNAYTLNITDLKDDLFGYYHCIVMYNDNSLKTVRKGVNVNGPDYSKLHEQYRNSAMIGGIAAAVMLVVIGAGCLVYHFRFRQEEEERDDLYKVSSHHSKGLEVAYDNNAMAMEEKSPSTPDDKIQGTLDEKL